MNKIYIITTALCLFYLSSIQAQASNLSQKDSKILSQERKIHQLETLFSNISLELNENRIELKRQIKELTYQKNFIATQKRDVDLKESKLKKLETDINTKKQEFNHLNTKVNRQEELLHEHIKTIDAQKTILRVITISLVGFLLLSIIAIYMFRKQNRTNILLQKANTLLKETKKELSIAKNKADSASLSKSKFIASMSHELRTPLNAVLGYSQLLQRDKSFSAKHQKTFSTIRSSGEHLLGLINDILLISKMESGNITVNTQNTNINELINSMHQMFVLKTDSKLISLNTNIDSSLPKFIMIDSDKIRQIFINLLNNAVKFTNDGGITVEASSVDDKLMFCVKDTGRGIANHEINKLFKSYEQTDSGIEEGSGTGLGLAIVHEFVKLLGGEVKVQSVLDKGSSFSVEIPYKKSLSQNVKKISPKIISLAPNQGHINILIVDDIKTNRELLDETLSNIGLYSTTVTNGKEAVQYVQNARPDLILMDIRMPIMDGKEASKIILQIDSTIPIIAITASIVEMEVLMNNPKPFVAALPKPFNDMVLFQTIEKHSSIKFVFEEMQTSHSESSVNLKGLENNIKEELLKHIKLMNITGTKNIISSLDDILLNEKEYMNQLVTNFEFDKFEKLLSES